MTAGLSLARSGVGRLIPTSARPRSSFFWSAPTFSPPRTAELAESPVLEEAAEGGEALTPAAGESRLEREREAEPADEANPDPVEQPEAALSAPRAGEPSQAEADAFEKIDFDCYFDQYLEPGSKAPAAASWEKSSFETFVSSPSTLVDLRSGRLEFQRLWSIRQRACMQIVDTGGWSGHIICLEEKIVNC